MWPYLNSDRDYDKIEKWIVEYDAQEFSSSQAVSGGPVTNAKVRLSQNGHIKYRTTTDAEGNFVVKAVKAGKYLLKISKNGYNPYKQYYQMNQSNVTPLEITMEKKSYFCVHVLDSGYFLRRLHV